MPKEYSQEELWKIYNLLPQELQEAIFSAEITENIRNICLRNEVKEEKISQVARGIGDVFLGLLPPADFKEFLEKEINLKPEKAKEVYHEINRFIFFPVKHSLQDLYKAEIILSLKKEKEKPAKEDVYREPVV
ncbi:MAG: hypothetical protein KY055_00600 [Candidatus Nealsonbacteria bacterium]|nr:hypothetical protein [Candidatus Nealsonbacteria bacterium]